MGSWGVSDFFSVDDDFSPTSSSFGASSASSTSQRQGVTAASSSSSQSRLQSASHSQISISNDDNGNNSVKNNGRTTADATAAAVATTSSRGVKRKQTPSVSSLSQDANRKTVASFVRKTSFTKHPSFDNSSSSSSSCSSSRSEIWADKHSPISADQLSVHPKKVQEVRQWLRSYYSQNAGQSRVVSPFLLLTGPSGSGKSATVKALAADLNVVVAEWANPSDTRSGQDEREIDQLLMEGGKGGGKRFFDGGESTAFQPSQINAFSDFILRTNKYHSLPMGGSSSSSSSSSSFSSATLILIDEFPNAFLRDPAPFHNLLSEYNRRKQPHPIVFVVSNSSSSSTSDSVMLKLFPKNVHSSLDFSTISFNAVAATYITSALKKISAKESAADSGIVAANPAILDSITINANGDLRAAINNLQFQSLRVTSSAFKESLKLSSQSSSSSRAASKSQKTAKSGSKAAECGQKDSSLFLFHALGKILHCKRSPAAASSVKDSSAAATTSKTNGAMGATSKSLLNATSLSLSSWASSSSSSSPSSERPLPPHLLHLQRDPLQCIPEDVVAKTSVSAEFFSLYLHQNYPEYFVNIEDIGAAAEYLTIADSISASWITKDAMKGYESSLATRAILFCNSSKAKSSETGNSRIGPSSQRTAGRSVVGGFGRGGGGGGGGGFRPMKKSQYFEMTRRRRENLSSLSSGFRELRETPENLAMTTLPAIKRLQRDLPTENQNKIAKELTTFKKGFFGTNSEVLKEGEVVGGVEDEEEEERPGVRDKISLPFMEGGEEREEGTNICQYDDELVEIDDVD